MESLFFRPGLRRTLQYLIEQNADIKRAIYRLDDTVANLTEREQQSFDAVINAIASMDTTLSTIIQSALDGAQQQNALIATMTAKIEELQANDDADAAAIAALTAARDGLQVVVDDQESDVVDALAGVTEALSRTTDHLSHLTPIPTQPAPASEAQADLENPPLGEIRR